MNTYDFLALKAEVGKCDINKLVNVATSLNNLKTKLVDLDVGKLKTVPINLKKLSDVEGNNLEKKIPDGTNLIHMNQYNTDIQNLKKNIGDVDKKYQIQVV